jgi:PPM family protein phosphatase
MATETSVLEQLNQTVTQPDGNGSSLDDASQPITPGDLENVNSLTDLTGGPKNIEITEEDVTAASPTNEVLPSQQENGAEQVFTQINATALEASKQAWQGKEDHDSNMNEWRGQMDKWLQGMDQMQQTAAGEIFAKLGMTATQDAEGKVTGYDWDALYNLVMTSDGSNFDSAKFVKTMQEKVGADTLKAQTGMVEAVAGMFGPEAAKRVVEQINKPQAVLEEEKPEVTNALKPEDTGEQTEDEDSEEKQQGVHFATESAIGERDEQQDFTFTRESSEKAPLPRGISQIGILGDGHGNEGGRSSKMAGQYFESKLLDLLRNDNSISIEEAMKQAVAHANDQIKPYDGGTTFVATVQIGEKVYMANVGDSRTYHYDKDKGTSTQMSKDHSWENHDRKFGIMVSRSLGDQEIVDKSNGEFTNEPDITSFDVKPGDFVLLCSDGLHGVLKDQQIWEILKNSKTPQEASKALMDAAKASGIDDNTSLTVMQVSEKK